MSDARTGDPEYQQAQESQTPRKRGLFRRGEDGLTTLEWLLIVAAVAGLAALAVVLVQNVVDDTAEQIGGSSARKTAAQVAAVSIMAEANRDSGSQPTGAKTYSEWDTYYTKKCDRLKITYSNVEDIKVTANFLLVVGGTPSVGIASTVVAAQITPLADVTGTTNAAPSAGTAVAECHVS